MLAPLTLRAYKVGFDVIALQTAVKAFLSQADKIENVQNHLEWCKPDEMEFLKDAFHPQTNAKEFFLLFEQVQKQQRLKTRRLRAGFVELKGQRKGIRGWWQKFSDKKELALPVGADIFEWLQQSKRLHLLVSLHDSFLSRVMIAEPTEIDLDEITALSNPVAETISTLDRPRAKRLAAALSCPLRKISADFLLNELQGYVTYNMNTGFALYYA